jgi:hypothetical protein
MTDLSPAARAVWEAAMNTPDHMPYEYDIAAALRAAALYSYCPVDRRILMTIADELENAQ